jgi:mRNA interferase MazF
MVNYQWNIFRASLDPVKGSEQSGTRPVLIISAEEANESLPIVTVISLTSAKPGRKVYLIESLLKAEDTGLPRDSIAMAHQIRAISKERLCGMCGQITSEEVKVDIKRAIKLYLDM